MNDKRDPQPDALEDEIEQAIEDKHDAILAADATGMVRNEEFIQVVALREGEVTPPV
jgi:predicted DNA-binding protein